MADQQTFFNQIDFNSIDWSAEDVQLQVMKLVLTNFTKQLASPVFFADLLHNGASAEDIANALKSFTEKIQSMKDLNELNDELNKFFSTKIKVGDKEFNLFPTEVKGLEKSPREQFFAKLSNMGDVLNLIIDARGKGVDPKDLQQDLQLLYGSMMVDIVNGNIKLISTELTYDNASALKSMKRIDATLKYNETIDALIEQLSNEELSKGNPVVAKLIEIYGPVLQGLKLTLDPTGAGLVYSKDPDIQNLQRELINLVNNGQCNANVLINKIFFAGKDGKSRIPLFASLLNGKKEDLLKIQQEYVGSLKAIINSTTDPNEKRILQEQLAQIEKATAINFVYSVVDFKRVGSDKKFVEKITKIGKSSRGLKTPSIEAYSKLLATNYMQFVSILTDNPILNKSAFDELLKDYQSINPLPEYLQGCEETLQLYQNLKNGLDTKFNYLINGSKEIILAVVKDKIRQMAKDGKVDGLLHLGFDNKGSGVYEEIVQSITKHLPDDLNEEIVNHIKLQIKKDIVATLTGEYKSAQHDQEIKKLLDAVVVKKEVTGTTLTLAQDLILRDELMIFDVQNEYNRIHSKDEGFTGVEKYHEKNQAYEKILTDLILDKDKFDALTDIQKQALKSVFKCDENGNFVINKDSTGKAILVLNIDGAVSENGLTPDQVRGLCAKLIKCKSIIDTENVLEKVRKAKTKEERKKAIEEAEKLLYSTDPTIENEARAKALGKPAKPIWTSPKAKYEYYCALLKRLNSVRSGIDINQVLNNTQKDLREVSLQEADELKQLKIDQGVQGLIYKTVQERTKRQLKGICKQYGIEVKDGESYFANKTLAKCVKFYYKHEPTRDEMTEIAKVLGIITEGLSDKDLQKELENKLKPIVRLCKIEEKTGVILQFDNSNGTKHRDENGKVLNESQYERREIAKMAKGLEDGLDPKLGTKYRVDIAKMLEGSDYKQWEEISSILIENGIKIFDDNGMRDINAIMAECKDKPELKSVIDALPTIIEKIDKVLEEEGLAIGEVENIVEEERVGEDDGAGAREEIVEETQKERTGQNFAFIMVQQAIDNKIKEIANILGVDIQSLEESIKNPSEEFTKRLGEYKLDLNSLQMIIEVRGCVGEILNSKDDKLRNEFLEARNIASGIIGPNGVTETNPIIKKLVGLLDKEYINLTDKEFGENVAHLTNPQDICSKLFDDNGKMLSEGDISKKYADDPELERILRLLRQKHAAAINAYMNRMKLEVVEPIHTQDEPIS